MSEVEGGQEWVRQLSMGGPAALMAAPTPYEGNPGLAAWGDGGRLQLQAATCAAKPCPRQDVEVLEPQGCHLARFEVRLRP